MYAHAPNLVGAALVLGNKLKAFIKPGSQENSVGAETYPGFLVDRFSTESMKILLHAPDLGRSQKLKLINPWSDIHSTLRVCSNYSKSPEKLVCYQCEKCLNTILLMDVQGVIQEYPHYSRPVPSARFLSLAWSSSGLAPYRKNLTKYFLSKKRVDLYLVYWAMLPFHMLKVILHHKIFNSLPGDLKFRIKKLFFPDRLRTK